MNDKWIRDTGLTFALVSLLLGYRYHPGFLLLAAAFIVLLMFFPNAFRPLAALWLTVTEVLGAVMGRVFFGLVFVAIIVPVGLARRLMWGDKRDNELHRERKSELVDAVGVITKEHLIKPY
jgi:hypothetical protein